MIHRNFSAKFSPLFKQNWKALVKLEFGLKFEDIRSRVVDDSNKSKERSYCQNSIIILTNFTKSVILCKKHVVGCVVSVSVKQN